MILVDNSLLYYKTPLEVIRDFSALGPRRFLEKILEKHSVKFTYNLERTLWGGLRFVQGLAYATDYQHSDYIPAPRVFSKMKRPTLSDVEDAIPVWRGVTLANPVPPVPVLLRTTEEQRTHNQYHEWQTEIPSTIRDVLFTDGIILQGTEGRE